MPHGVSATLPPSQGDKSMGMETNIMKRSDVDDNEEMFKASRKSYVDYRTAKRRLNNNHEAHNSTYFHLENNFAKHMQVHTKALCTLDKDMSKEILEAYQNLRQAKLNHDLSRQSFTQGYRSFRDKEIQYSITIFKGIRQVFGGKVADIKRIFGIHLSMINRWMRGNPKELEKQYKDEFGGGA